MFYHKVYMNQIHSSSLLCQLATMWKNQVLCDAVIKAGNISTKAHRVVLVAACPMLHSMKNASSGSNLEIRLAADIKQEAITTFLQYLYEGFMMLTEDNCKDVEKIARVLQVESVLKCCADFYKCLHTGGEGYEYNFHNNGEFRHVRASDMLKVHDKMKRSSDSSRPTSPGIKRQRLQRASTSSDHGHQEFTNAAAVNADPWDRVPKEGLLSHTSSSKGQQPGIVDMIEDSVEIVSAEPPDDSGGTRRSHSSQDRVAISVSSQVNTASDVQIVNVSGSLYAMPKPGGVSQSDSHTSLSSTQFMNQSHSTAPYTRDTSVSHSKSQRSDTLPVGQYHSPSSYTPPSQKTFSAPHPQARMPSPIPHLQAKPFAAGSMSQASLSHAAAVSTTVSTSPSTYSPVAGLGRRSDIIPQQTHPPDKTTANTANRTETQTFTTDDIECQSDLSIVKIEAPEIDNPEESENPSAVDPNDSFCPDDPPSDWGHEDVSNEGSTVSGERQPWMSESFKEEEIDTHPEAGSEADETTGLKAAYDSSLSIYLNRLVDLHSSKFHLDSSTGNVKANSKDSVEHDQSQSSILRGLDLTVRSQQQHIPIYNKDRKYTPCLYCGKLKNRTRSGWRVNTFYRCQQCDVPLCVNDRNCFVLYHRYFLGIHEVGFPNRRRSKDGRQLDIK